MRKNAGLTIEQLAERTDLSTSYVSRLETGIRTLTLDQMDAFAKALGCAVNDLFPARTGSILGYVGAGATVFSIDDHEHGTGLEDDLSVPAGLKEEAVAVIVRGDSQFPAYRDGDVIWYDTLVEGDLTSLLGQECVVRTADGRTLLKTITPGSGRGLWTLTSYNATPMLDIPVTWAARVKIIDRR